MESGGDSWTATRTFHRSPRSPDASPRPCGVGGSLAGLGGPSKRRREKNQPLSRDPREDCGFRMRHRDRGAGRAGTGRHEAGHQGPGVPKQFLREGDSSAPRTEPDAEGLTVTLPLQDESQECSALCTLILLLTTYHQPLPSTELPWLTELTALRG